MKLYEKKTPIFRHPECSTASEIDCIYFMDNGKFKAHYIPLFALASGKVTAKFVIQLQKDAEARSLFLHTSLAYSLADIIIFPLLPFPLPLKKKKAFCIELV